MFETGIPKPVQNMIAQLIQTAAPDLARQIDSFGQMVQSFKLQLDRIEMQNRAIMAHFDIAIFPQLKGNSNGTGNREAENGADDTGNAHSST